MVSLLERNWGNSAMEKKLRKEISDGIWWQIKLEAKISQYRTTANATAVQLPYFGILRGGQSDT